MSEPLIHFIIPFAILIMCGVGVKKSAFFAALATLPDLDVLFHIHRSFSHSIFFILLICTPIIVIAAAKHSKRTTDAVIATLVMLSHPFIDLFSSFTPVFYPLYNKSICIVTGVVTDLDAVSQLRFLFDVKIEPTVFHHTTSMDVWICTGEGIAITLVVLIGLALKCFLEGVRSGAEKINR